jgi:hypothetical protein
MTWTKIDSGSTDDPVLLKLPRGVRLLHIEALVWCNGHGTDGRVTLVALRRITDEPDPELAAKELVEAGKWSTTEDGWEIVGFLDDQPSAADVARTMELTRQRQRRQRQHRNGDHTLCDEKYCHASRVTERVSHGVSHDTRTDPIRSVPKRLRRGEGEGAAGAAAPSGSRQRAGPPQRTGSTSPRRTSHEQAVDLRHRNRVRPVR